MPTVSKTAKATKPRVRTRDVAIYRYVWDLTEEDKQKLDRCWHEVIPFEDFNKLLKDDHPVSDQINAGGYLFEVIYLNCNYEILKDTGTVCVSYRQNFDSRMAIALVRPPITCKNN